MISIWSNAAVATLFPGESVDQDEAARCGEMVSGIVERCTDLTIIRRALPDLYRSAVSDPINLPRQWWPNPLVTAVVGSNDPDVAPDVWPALPYDFDRTRRIYSRGGWPVLKSKPGKTITFNAPSVALHLPTVRVSGVAGILSAPLDEDLGVPVSAAGYADLFGAAEDLLRIVWAMRQAGPLISAEEIETGDNTLTWAKDWPMHVRKTFDRYRADRNVFGEEERG